MKFQTKYSQWVVKHVSDMKFHFSIVLMVVIFSTSCQRDIDVKRKLIHATLELIPLQDSAVILKESATNWCTLNNVNICNLNQMVEIQKDVYSIYKQPHLDTLLESDEFESVFKDLQQKIVFHETDFPPNLKPISQDELSAKSSFELSHFSYYLISAPVISSNGKYGFIYFAEHCGMECGGGDFIVFEWDNDNWVKLIRIPLWLS